MTKSDHENATADAIFRVVAATLDHSFGPDWHIRNDQALGDARFFADVLAERLHACNLHSCVDCGRLTDAYWKNVAMCSACQDRNPGIQQMKAVS